MAREQEEVMEDVGFVILMVIMAIWALQKCK